VIASNLQAAMPKWQGWPLGYLEFSTLSGRVKKQVSSGRPRQRRKSRLFGAPVASSKKTCLITLVPAGQSR
jgi:hypothetical protein